VGLIRELDYNTIVKIAAGEVIERPASIVRELLDNAIDAGADRISVGVSNGGKSYIEVQDNGKGMDRDDLVLCIKNHATSKITSFEDIDTLKTLGFRGEALSSIAEVSRVVILSRHEGSTGGYRMESGGGKINVTETGMNTGTTVIVKDLFYSLPAREKFLSGPQAEQKQLEREIVKKALAFPGISFEFISEGKRKYISPKKGTCLERIADFYPDAAAYLIPVEGISGNFSISGFVTKPVFLRPNRMYQSFYVNRRAVEWKNFYFIINNAYGNLIPRGYYPGVFLFLTIDPAFVDVNVHPMKKEVRFRDEALITRNAGEAVKRSIERNTGISESDEGEVRFTPFEEKIGSAISSFMTVRDQSYAPPGDLFKREGAKEEIKLSLCRYIGSLFMTYLLFENEDEMIMVDQHAAHERINYEKLKGRFEKHLLDAQEFLNPVSLEVRSGIVDELISNLPLLKSMGFSVEHFGGSGFLISAAPPFIDYRDAADALKGFIETLEENPGGAKPLDFIDRALKQMACKRSVRAREALSKDEALALVKEWEETPNRFSCPHGRPVAFSISKHDIEKQFKRLGF
jgi:DNA mismatch repair protein MutL